MKRIYPFIAVEGNIGAGKTTLCHRMAQHAGCALVLEQFTDNPFLPQSIRDRLQHSLAQPPAPLTTLAPGLKQAPYNAEPLNTDAIGLEAALRQRLGPVIDNLIESQLDTLRSELRVRLRAEMDQLIAEHLRK